MNDPFPVSVIVRTYNRRERLRECLQCLRRQTYRALEIVVVNDAGVDVTDVIHDELEGISFQSIRNRENLGRTAGLNIGVEAATSEYVCFVDDDDGVYPDHVATLAAAAGAERLPVVYSDVINVTFVKDEATGNWQRVKEQLIYSFDFEKDNFLLANYIPITCLLIRKNCFREVGPFDESLLIYEDWEFLIRLSRKFPFRHVRKITGEYRRRDDNSNILEQSAYPFNERVVKRRYGDDRNAAFDPIFKRTFQQQREIRELSARFDQVLRQANQLQAQLAEAHKSINRLQQENMQLRSERTR
ncbi:MAG: glycosyltransferase [Candidatus Omnitrophota bacterium]|jgi:glycosyltransferase involved in cell wall biosynthesis|nr:MAG: glycosyltransferase [Candidatus Omnitrophota bacterium]